MFLASDRAAGVTGRLFSASGGYVGLFADPAESLLAFRDHRRHAPWTQDELATALLASGPLARAPEDDPPR